MKVIKEYWLELLVLISLGLGLFLIIEPFKIARSLVDSIANYDRRAASILARVYPAFQQRISADMIGLTFLFIALLILYLRARKRFIKYNYLFISGCPRCGSVIHRIHRTDLDLLFGQIFFLELKRYQCVTEACRWSGIRKGRLINYSQQELEFELDAGEKSRETSHKEDIDTP